MHTMTINGSNLGVKEFGGQRVVTFHDIDAVHKRPDGTARNAFRRNRKRFVEGVDYFLPKHWNMPEKEIGEDGQGGVRETYKGLDAIAPHLASAQGVTLITESGYLMLAKVFDDTLAWAIQRELVNCYFKAKPPITLPPDNKASTGNAIAEASKPRTPPSAKLVVDTPINHEAQRIMTEIRNGCTALPVVLSNYNRYLSAGEAEKYKGVMFDLGSYILANCADLERVKLKEINDPW